MKLTTNERRILEVLAMKRHWGDCGAWQTPTRIGLTCGKPHYRASSWACRYLCQLRDRGLVRREPPGEYRITDKGIAELEGK